MYLVDARAANWGLGKTQQQAASADSELKEALQKRETAIELKLSGCGSRLAQAAISRSNRIASIGTYSLDSAAHNAAALSRAPALLQHKAWQPHAWPGGAPGPRRGLAGHVW